MANTNDNRALAEVLRKQLNIETDGDIKSLVLQLLGDIARQPQIDAIPIVSDALAQVQITAHQCVFTNITFCFSFPTLQRRSTVKPSRQSK